MSSASSQRGFLAIEIILSITTLGIIAITIGGLFAQGQTATVSAGERTRAFLLAYEGLEAVRSMRDNESGLFTLEMSVEDVSDTPYELDRIGFQWNLIPSTNQLIDNRYTQTIRLGQFINPENETEEIDARVVYSTVDWDQDTDSKAITLVGLVSNWQVEVIPEDIIE